MPDYAAQIPAEDRWAIVAYIRALQLSEHADARRRAGRPSAEQAPSDARSTQTADVAIPELAGTAAPAADRRRRRALRVAASGCSSNPTQFFQSYLMAYMLVPRRHARLPRARHGAPALGRRLGRRRSAGRSARRRACCR